jgi:pimeloyl-ACP methyl ester carboxylesterase
MTDMTITNGSTKLAASVYGPLDAPPILFLHGRSLSRDTWEEIAQRLSNRYRIWTVDFRGHGHSDRASSYELPDYVSDAEAVLAAIGRPTIVVGHSLGGCVAGTLAQQRPNVRAAFLEDPPWFFGQPAEWRKSTFPQLFAFVSAQHAAWQKEGAPLAAYVTALSNAPAPMGGKNSDHFNARHLLSHASALQRLDNRTWHSVAGDAADGILTTIATDKPFRCPVKIIQADSRYGAALLEGHEQRLAKINPQAEIVQYRDCGHSPHRAHAFAERFFTDLEAFIAAAG